MARKTRLEKAAELNRLLKKGPSLSLDVFGLAGQDKLTKEQAEEIKIRIVSWISSWVEPLASDLIPEYDEIQPPK